MELREQLKGSKSSIESTKGKLSLDNTELYDSTGKTIGDIQGLEPKEILEILDIKKEFPKEPK